MDKEKDTTVHEILEEIKRRGLEQLINPHDELIERSKNTEMDLVNTIEEPIDDSIQIKTVNGYKTFLKSFQDWSEVVSKSGKVYFYNKKTLVNQWEKPKEWLEAENELNQCIPAPPIRGQLDPLNPNTQCCPSKLTTKANERVRNLEEQLIKKGDVTIIYDTFEDQDYLARKPEHETFNLHQKASMKPGDKFESNNHNKNVPSYPGNRLPPIQEIIRNVSLSPKRIQYKDTLSHCRKSTDKKPNLSLKTYKYSSKEKNTKQSRSMSKSPECKQHRDRSWSHNRSSIKTETDSFTSNKKLTNKQICVTVPKLPMSRSMSNSSKRPLSPLSHSIQTKDNPSSTERNGGHATLKSKSRSPIRRGKNEKLRLVKIDSIATTDKSRSNRKRTLKEKLRLLESDSIAITDNRNPTSKENNRIWPKRSMSRSRRRTRSPSHYSKKAKGDPHLGTHHSPLNGRSYRRVLLRSRSKSPQRNKAIKKSPCKERSRISRNSSNCSKRRDEKCSSLVGDTMKSKTDSFTNNKKSNSQERSRTLLKESLMKSITRRPKRGRSPSRHSIRHKEKAPFKERLKVRAMSKSRSMSPKRKLRNETVHHGHSILEKTKYKQISVSYKCRGGEFKSSSKILIKERKSKSLIKRKKAEKEVPVERLNVDSSTDKKFENVEVNVGTPEAGSPSQIKSSKSSRVQNKASQIKDDPLNRYSNFTAQSLPSPSQAKQKPSSSISSSKTVDSRSQNTLTQNESYSTVPLPSSSAEAVDLRVTNNLTPMAALKRELKQEADREEDTVPGDADVDVTAGQGTYFKPDRLLSLKPGYSPCHICNSYYEDDIDNKNKHLIKHSDQVFKVGVPRDIFFYDIEEVIGHYAKMGVDNGDIAAKLFQCNIVHYPLNLAAYSCGKCPPGRRFTNFPSVEDCKEHLRVSCGVGKRKDMDQYVVGWCRGCHSTFPSVRQLELHVQHNQEHYARHGEHTVKTHCFPAKSVVIQVYNEVKNKTMTQPATGVKKEEY